MPRASLYAKEREDSRGRHVPFACEGIPYVAAGALITLTAALLDQPYVAWPFLILTLLMGHFFRDPVRWSNASAGHLISPADGKVVEIEPTIEPHFTNRPCTKIGIFMSILDVHVNRIPISGTVRGIYYQKGRYLPAQKSKASCSNEQNWIFIQTDDGREVVISQVAGWIARRIVCWLSSGDQVHQGERFGMIRFGSRVDVYVVGECDVIVKKGEKVFAGETILCQLK